MIRIVRATPSNTTNKNEDQDSFINFSDSLDDPSTTEDLKKNLVHQRKVLTACIIKTLNIAIVNSIGHLDFLSY